jgi:hypothetical protein
MSTTETKVRLQGGEIITVWTSETRDEARARVNAAAVASIIESHADMLEALEAVAQDAGFGTLPIELRRTVNAAIAKARRGAE